jgi:hypothetical protein
MSLSQFKFQEISQRAFGSLYLRAKHRLLAK